MGVVGEREYVRSLEVKVGFVCWGCLVLGGWWKANLNGDGLRGKRRRRGRRGRKRKRKRKRV